MARATYEMVFGAMRPTLPDATRFGDRFLPYGVGSTPRT